MVQLLEFLILETLAPPTTRPVQCEEKEGCSLCQRGDNKTKRFTGTQVYSSIKYNISKRTLQIDDVGGVSAT